MNDVQDTSAGNSRARELHSSLISAWATLVQANNTLVNGYLLAHSFIVVASATVLAKSVNSESPLLASVLAVLSIGGLWLAVLMTETWARNTARSRLLAWHLEQLEADGFIYDMPRHTDRTDVFLDMARARNKQCLQSRHPHVPVVDRWFNPNRATWRKARGGGPVKRSTYIIASVHATFLGAAVRTILGILSAEGKSLETLVIVIASVSGFLALAIAWWRIWEIDTRA